LWWFSAPQGQNKIAQGALLSDAAAWVTVGEGTWVTRFGMVTLERRLAMPWEVHPVSELRSAFVHHVDSLGQPVAAAGRLFGISRKTGHKWLARHRRQPGEPLRDRSRRPLTSPDRTPAAVERAVLEARDRFGWGPRKIHAYLRQCGRADLPTARTVAAILRRHGRVGPAAPPPAAGRRFERSRPNDLWPCDFKGWLEVGRRRVHPFTVLDDHSRFLLALTPCLDVTLATAWQVLWDVFGEFGLPEGLLCDNAFAGHHGGLRTLSWFEARALRLGVRPHHGRPYHPQTQGKVERLHGTLERELWPRVDRSSLAAFARGVRRWRTEVYNPVRPHEALGDAPPLSRWRPSRRRRPARLPPVAYPAGATVRKVAGGGDVSWRGYRLLAGPGLAGEWVQVEEGEGTVVVAYAGYRFRRIPVAELRHGVLL
jgi:transposase InsO family protein